MRSIRIWAVESEHDKDVAEILAKKIVRHYQCENINIKTAGKNAYNSVAKRLRNKPDALKKAVEIYLMQDDRVIFVLDSDSDASLTKRRSEAFSMVNQIERVVESAGFSGRVCKSFAVQELEADTEKIVEPISGGKGAKEYLVDFSRQILKKLNPNLKKADIRKNEYTESLASDVSEYIEINEETLRRNSSLRKFAEYVYAD